MNVSALLQSALDALRVRPPPGVSRAELDRYLARHRRTLEAVLRDELAQAAEVAPVAIPWTADAVPGLDGAPVGRFDEAKARSAGVRWWRDHADLAPGFAPLPAFDDYDLLAVQVSGGKDSVACLTVLRRLLAARPDLWRRVEIWHQDVDGGGAPFMDWPVTRPYVDGLGALFGLPVVVSYREGGFYGELMRRPGEARGAKVLELDGEAVPLGKPPGTVALGRRRFPALTADLRTRWCSAELKIDVARALLGLRASEGARRILVISGERAAESRPRAHYHRGQDPGLSSARRQVHQLRLVLDHTDEEVWDELRLAFPGERWGIQPHPAYELGWARCSCAGCVFSSPADLARLRAVLPDQFARLAGAEAALVAEAEAAHPEAAREAARLREDLARAPRGTRGAIRRHLAALGRDVGRTLVPDRTVVARADAAGTRLPPHAAFWRPYADGSEPWTADHGLRGPDAPVFRFPWTLPAGATARDSAGPPT